MKMKWKKPKWAVSQLIRETGLVEDICKCGVGHPNKEFLIKYKEYYSGIHGCCGCCNDKKLDN